MPRRKGGNRPPSPIPRSAAPGVCRISCPMMWAGEVVLLDTSRIRTRRLRASIGAGVDQQANGKPTGVTWRRHLVPGVADMVFGLILVSVMIGGRTGFLNDPGTCWHLRLGREIVRTGSVPRSDTLTYTREQVAWVDQSWAFDLGLALLVDRWGWSAAIALT